MTRSDLIKSVAKASQLWHSGYLGNEASTVSSARASFLTAITPLYKHAPLSSSAAAAVIILLLFFLPYPPTTAAAAGQGLRDHRGAAALSFSIRETCLAVNAQRFLSKRVKCSGVSWCEFNSALCWSNEAFNRALCWWIKVFLKWNI